MMAGRFKVKMVCHQGLGQPPHSCRTTGRRWRPTGNRRSTTRRRCRTTENRSSITENRSSTTENRSSTTEKRSFTTEKRWPPLKNGRPLPKIGGRRGRTGTIWPVPQRCQGIALRRQRISNTISVATLCHMTPAAFLLILSHRKAMSYCIQSNNAVA